MPFDPRWEPAWPCHCRWPRALLAATALSLGASGCSNGGTELSEATTTTSTTTTTSMDDTSTTSDGEVVLGQACTNPEAGYSLEFPEGWSTNEPSAVPSCRYFHPRPFEVPQHTEVFDLAVSVRVDEVPFTEVASEGDSLADREISREEAAVAGRQAVRVEAESTDGGLLPEGVHSYRYHLDLGERTLTAATQDVGDLDYEMNKRVLDRMMETLDLDA